jgi:hypothetical protein
VARCDKIVTNENNISGLFLRNRPLHLFPGPNGLCGAIRGEIFMNENFARFCLNGLEIIFPKNTFPVRFYETAPLTYFRGQTDYVARCEAKLSRTKTSLAFA